MPPEKVTGMNETAGVVAVSARLAIASVAVRTALITRFNGWVTTAPAASVPVIVKFADAQAATGVPEIAPVLGLKDKAAGSAGVTDHT